MAGIARDVVLGALAPFINSSSSRAVGGADERGVVSWEGWARLHVTETSVPGACESCPVTVDAPTARNAVVVSFGSAAPDLDAQLMRAEVQVDTLRGCATVRLDGHRFGLALARAGRVLCCSEAGMELGAWLVQGRPFASTTIAGGGGGGGGGGNGGGDGEAQRGERGAADRYKHPLQFTPSTAAMEVPRASSVTPFASLLFQECGINFVPAPASSSMRASTLRPANDTNGSGPTTRCRVGGVTNATDTARYSDEVSIRLLATALASAWNKAVEADAAERATRGAQNATTTMMVGGGATTTGNGRGAEADNMTASQAACAAPYDYKAVEACEIDELQFCEKVAAFADAICAGGAIDRIEGLVAAIADDAHEELITMDDGLVFV